MTCIIFCAALSDYDQVLLEDKSQVCVVSCLCSLNTSDHAYYIELDERVSHALRFCYQLAVVHAHLVHPLPHQNRRVQEEASQGVGSVVDLISRTYDCG